MTLQSDNYERQRGEGPALDRYRAEQRHKYDTDREENTMDDDDPFGTDRARTMTSQPAPQETLTSKIEITPEMVEAGYDVLLASGITDAEVEADKLILADIFRAMLEASAALTAGRKT